MHCSLLDRLGFSENGQHFDRGLPISRITVEGHTDGRYVSATPKDLISDISRYVIDFRKTLVVQEIFLKNRNIVYLLLRKQVVAEFLV